MFCCRPHLTICQNMCFLIKINFMFYISLVLLIHIISITMAGYHKFKCQRIPWQNDQNRS
jgi:hypothetical protein